VLSTHSIDSPLPKILSKYQKREEKEDGDTFLGMQSASERDVKTTGLCAHQLRCLHLVVAGSSSPRKGIERSVLESTAVWVEIWEESYLEIPNFSRCGLGAADGAFHFSVPSLCPLRISWLGDLLVI